MSLAHDPAHRAGGDPPPHSFFRHAEREHAQPVPGLVAGKVVGDFRLVKLLGQGGMGQVWEAEQVSLGHRVVAVKFVRPERVTAYQLELFAREARAGGRLSHSGIVGVHGHGQSDGLAWIAMELVSGAWSLRDFLDEVSRAEEVPADYDRHVASFVAEIADAMQVAHDAGVIHRDLKPQNVLVTPEERPKVTDFGLARITDESALSQTGDVSGTFLYMSPEQVTAERQGLDHRSDVFSLGVVLYELLALRRPFEGDTIQQVAEQIVSKDPPDPRSIRSKVPRDLAVIAGKALEKARDRRYQTMAELAADLRRWLSNEPIQATPPTRVDRTVKWVKRNPTKSAVTTLAGAALIVISALLAKNVQTNKALARTNSSLESKTAEAEARRGEAVRAAEGEKAAADRERLAAEKERRRADEVLRLSALQELDDLLAEADRLWPAHPELIVRYAAWIERARALVVDLHRHEAQRAELRSRALPRTEEERLAERESHPEFGRWQALVATLERQLEVISGAATAEEQRSAEEELERMDAERAKLDLLLGERRDWRFAEEEREARWWNNQLTKLIAGLEDLEGSLLAENATSAAHGWSMPKRHAFAASVAERSVSGTKAEARWAEALSSIADRSECPPYGGLVLEPQMGLLPIGRDPESGLWEFAHLQTGEIAERGADGKLVLTEATGLVFVLLPGATFTMGAQKDDLSQPNYDPQAETIEGPVHEVVLSPYFLSKYEMTQGQWLRFVGGNPSLYHPPGGLAPSWLHPVEQVSWSTCEEVMGRLGLSLPSEAQWECGARGGTTSAWWTGDERESLIGATNLADQAAARAGAPWQNLEDWPELDDGSAVHAPVNHYAPNHFGLHNVHGNVWEWCLDGFVSDFYGQGSKKDPVSHPAGSSNRVYRGGGFAYTAMLARSATRSNAPPENAVSDLGLRPARILAGSFTTSPLTPVGR